MNFLLSTERVALLSQHKKERDGRVKDRLKVILWYDEGRPIKKIAKLLFLNSATVNRHLQEYRERRKLKPSNGGSQPKLSEEQSNALSKHLEEKTYTKVKEISDYIVKKYGIKYSNSGLTNWLQVQEFRYKKPKGIPSKLDEEAQKEFILKYKKLEKSISPEEEIIFMDSCHPTQTTKFGYGWIKKGKEKQIKTTASRTKINLTGAVNIQSRKVITEQYKTINSESTIDFLKKVLSSYPEAKTLHVIVDGAAYHKSKAVINFIKDKKIKLHVLPAYSPNLNPIERLWKIMNEYARNNRYFKDSKSFRTAIDNFFSDTIPKITEILYSRINSNFQIMKNAP